MESVLHQQAAEVWWEQGEQQELLTASAMLRTLESLWLMWFGAVLKPLCLLSGSAQAVPLGKKCLGLQPSHTSLSKSL